MKIMLIEHYAGTNRYGMEFRPYYMAREWVKAGHEVVIVAADYTHLRKINPSVARDFEEELIDGIRYVWIKTPEYHGNNAGRGKNMIAFVVKLLRGASMMARKYAPQAVIASSTYPMDIWPAAKIAKKSGAGLFFEIHDLWPLTLMEMGNLPWWNPIILVMQSAENYAYRHAAKIISILPDTDKYIRKRGFDDSKFVYIPNGVIPGEECSVTADDPQVLELKRLHDEGYFLIGYTGNHSISNSLEYFIGAGKLLADLKVKIVLVGDGNYKPRLIKAAREMDAGNVLFLDPVPKKSMGALLSQLDAAYMGLAKSKLFQYGVSPNKLFDYMLAKKPVVYAVEASNDPVALCGCGFSVPVESSEEIAGAIRRLHAMTPEQRLEMGTRGYRYVLENHNYDALAKRYTDTLAAGTAKKPEQERMRGL